MNLVSCIVKINLFSYMYIGVTPFDLLTIYCCEITNNQEVTNLYNYQDILYQPYRCSGGHITTTPQSIDLVLLVFVFNSSETQEVFPFLH